MNRPAPQTKTATASTTIAVTARSANTSLGDAVTACAAARAGLVRPAKLELLAYEEFDGATPITAHPVSTAGGFQGDARLLSLAYPALHALLAAAAPSPSAKVGFFLASPDLVARAAVIGAPSPRPSTLIDRLVSITGLSVPEPLRRAFPLGPTGFATAIQAATEALIRREASVCIVGAVDTLCDDLAIAALTAQKRLKTADNPVGLQPGEAAAFFILESLEGARGRKAPILAALNGVGVARDPREASEARIGEGLAQAVRELVTASGAPIPPGTFFVVDCNGEPGRASDWSWCQQRIMTEMPGVLPAPEWMPAINFGDTGAAGAALAAQMAVHAFRRAYAPGSSGVVVSANDDGGRAAFRLERVE